MPPSLPINLVLWILFWHWIADFVCQTDYMAKNKSKIWKVLFEHVCTYSMVLCLGLTLVYRGKWGIGFSSFSMAYFYCANFIGHFCTDAITSRITSRLLAAGKHHWFFVVIGIDQFIHYTTLILTASWLFYNA